jgi:acyl carrier protein
MHGRPDRDDVLAMLASYGNRAPEQVGDRIDSLELAWLVHQVEQRYAVTLDLSDEELGQMLTVNGAVDVLGTVLKDA